MNLLMLSLFRLYVLAASQCAVSGILVYVHVVYVLCFVSSAVHIYPLLLAKIKMVDRLQLG